MKFRKKPVAIGERVFKIDDPTVSGKVVDVGSFYVIVAYDALAHVPWGVFHFKKSEFEKEWRRV